MTRAPDSITFDELLRLRMRSLGLSGARADDGSGLGDDGGGAPGTTPVGADRIAAVASRMLAVQGQDWRSSAWALGVRAPGTTVDDVHAAFNAARIVRSWPMRGTVHVTAAEDIGWMQRATNHRVLAGAPKRRAFLGMSDETLDRLVDVSVQALRGLAAAGTGLDRERLAAIWTEAGIDWQSNWRYHIIWWLCQNGLATFGPVHGGEPLLVLADEWIGEGRDLEGDEALSELAARYASARGPVREKDLAWWTGLTVAEARRACALAADAGRLVPLRLDGVAGVAGALWAAPSALGEPLAAPGAAAGDSLLLAAFDEHLLGYTDRTAQLEPQHFERIVPGRNGMFLATVVSNGGVVGTWKRDRRKRGGLVVSPFPGSRIPVPSLTGAVGDWAAFHGVATPAVDVLDSAAVSTPGS